jgi:acyl dehydratase
MNIAIPIVMGEKLPILSKGRYTSSHLVRWCAAQQNWDKIHYDESYAKHTAGMRERVINGGLKQHFLPQFIAQAFGSAAPVPRLGYNFAGPDFINESLEVRGHIERETMVGGQRCLHLALEIWNLEQGKANTKATALVLPDACWEFDHHANSPTLPPELALDESIDAPDPAAPDYINALLGREVETVVSQYPLDMSRLRLFADAVGGLAPLHFDVKAGYDSVFGGVVAPPLFPIHSLEATPGSLPLSTEPDAMGREAVNEVGRNLSRRFGFPGSGMVNGGNEVEIHSLLRTGETARASSTLVTARIKESRTSGKMLMTVSLNRYFALSGRLLMKERQTIIYRNFDNVRNGSHS